MSKDLFDTITLNTFLEMLKKQYRITFHDLALELCVDERTLRRYKKLNSYIGLKADDYSKLFETFENLCHEYHRVDLLVDSFKLPKSFKKKTYEEIKEVIINNLDDKFAGKSSPSVESTPPIGPRQFLLECLDKEIGIESICMAFQTGWGWWHYPYMDELIQTINERHISIRVIANPESTIQQMASVMRKPEYSLQYTGFDDSLKKWDQWSKALNHLEIRVSEYPILRKIYIVRYKDGTQEALFRDYVYGHTPEITSHNTILTDKDPSLAVFKDEFDFLWKKGTSYSEWLSTIPEPQNSMVPGHYVLLYLTEANKKYTQEQFLEYLTVSDLQVERNNIIHLGPNIPVECWYQALPASSKYTYRGNAKMTRQNIYMTLCDETQNEQITMTFYRPYDNKKQFLGVMTALNPSAYPIACRCVCMERSLFAQIDLSQLRQILLGDTHTFGHDINLFYSKKFFTDI